MANAENMSNAPSQAKPTLADAFAQCSDAVYRFILYRVGGDRSVADELLQDCCHEAVRQRHCPTDPDRLGAWMAGIAKNLIRRHWRHRRRDRRNRPLDDPAVGVRLVEVLESTEESSLEAVSPDDTGGLMLAVTTLTPSEQRLVLGVYFEGWSLAKLAEEERTTAKAIEARLYRIRAKLRELLGDPTKAGDA